MINKLAMFSLDDAIGNYERRLLNAVDEAGDIGRMPQLQAGVISGLRRDLAALYEMRRDAEQKEALARRLEAIDQEYA